jgi:hypothetical protein
MRGTAIRLRDGDFDRHLFIVVSNPRPPENIVLVFNLTDLNHYRECPCVVDVGDHSFITKPSAVRYFDPRYWRVDTITQQLNAGVFEQFENASDDLLTRITCGALQSDDLDDKAKAFLRKSMAADAADSE